MHDLNRWFEHATPRKTPARNVPEALNYHKILQKCSSMQSCFPKSTPVSSTSNIPFPTLPFAFYFEVTFLTSNQALHSANPNPPKIAPTARWPSWICQRSPKKSSKYLKKTSTQTQTISTNKKQNALEKPRKRKPNINQT